MEVVMQLIMEMKNKIDELEVRINMLDERLTNTIKSKELEGNVLAFIRMRREVKLKDVYNAFPDIDARVIRMIISKLKKNKKVDKVERGIYRIKD